MSQAAGYLLNRFGLIALLAIFLLGAWFDQTAVAIISGLLLVAAAVAKLWSRCSLVRVRCQCILNQQRAFPDEEIELRLRVENRKPVPLPWLQFDIDIPAGLIPVNVPLTESSSPGNGCLSHISSMMWYTAINWQHQLLCKKRGYYRLGPFTVSSGDIFGFYPRASTLPFTEHVIVYPKIYPLAQLGLHSFYPIGEARSQRRIFQDPTRTIGVRDYSPGDSFRYIHWKATARHQNLQVKVFEPTTTLKVILFLAADSFQEQGGNRDDDFELGVSAAASIAYYAIQQRSQVGLFANASQVYTGHQVRIPAGSSQSQLINILEALAKVTLSPGEHFDEFLRAERRNLPWGATLVLIVYKPSESLLQLLTDLKEAGHKLLILQIGEPIADNLNHGLNCYHITSPANLSELTLGAGR